MNRSAQSGLSLVELLVGLVVSSLVLAGAFSLWNTHQQEGFRLEKKIELRNVMTLSSKRIQRSVTLAGLGLGGAANLSRHASAGSDTLTVFLNQSEGRCAITSNVIAGGTPVLNVINGSMFIDAEYVAVSNDTIGQIRRIVSRTGTTLNLDTAFSYDFKSASALAYPAMRERYFTDQENRQLIRETRDAEKIMAREVKDFRVSFRDKNGAATEIGSQIRTVVFSFTGIFPAREGALNSMTFSSTAIPRNTL